MLTSHDQKPYRNRAAEKSPDGLKENPRQSHEAPGVGI
jgi:hypothetical protein